MTRQDSSSAKTTAARTAGASTRAPRCCFEDADGRRVCSRAEYERIDGRAYCSQHGAAVREAAVQRLIEGETPARRWSGLSAQQAKAYQDVLRDPALLDLRGPLAAHRMLLDGILIPSDDLVERTAYSIAVADWHIEAPPEAWVGGTVGGELMPLRQRPTWEEVLPHHREQAKQRLHLKAIQHLKRFQEAANEAAKIGKIEDMIMLRVYPIMQKLGMAYARAIEEFVTDHTIADRLKAELDRAAAMVAADLIALSEEARR